MKTAVIKRLRQETGASLQDCLDALSRADHDYNSAKSSLLQARAEQAAQDELSRAAQLAHYAEKELEKQQMLSAEIEQLLVIRGLLGDNTISNQLRGLELAKSFGDYWKVFEGCDRNTLTALMNHDSIPPVPHRIIRSILAIPHPGKRLIFQIELQFSGSFIADNQSIKSLRTLGADYQFDLSDYNAEEDLEKAFDCFGFAREEWSFEKAISFEAPNDFDEKASCELEVLRFNIGARATYVLEISAKLSTEIQAAIVAAYEMVSCRVTASNIAAYDDAPTVRVIGPVPSQTPPP